MDRASCHLPLASAFLVIHILTVAMSTCDLCVALRVILTYVLSVGYGEIPYCDAGVGLNFRRSLDDERFVVLTTGVQRPVLFARLKKGQH